MLSVQRSGLTHTNITVWFDPEPALGTPLATGRHWCSSQQGTGASKTNDSSIGPRLFANDRLLGERRHIQIGIEHVRLQVSGGRQPLLGARSGRLSSPSVPTTRRSP